MTFLHRHSRPCNRFGKCSGRPFCNRPSKNRKRRKPPPRRWEQRKKPENQWIVNSKQRSAGFTFKCQLYTFMLSVLLNLSNWYLFHCSTLTFYTVFKHCYCEKETRPESILNATLDHQKRPDARYLGPLCSGKSAQGIKLPHALFRKWNVTNSTSTQKFHFSSLMSASRRQIIRTG